MTKLHTQTAQPLSSALQGFTIPKVFLDCRTHCRMPHVVRQGMLSYFEALSGLWLSQPWIAASLTAREWNLPGTDTALYVSSNWAQVIERLRAGLLHCANCDTDTRQGLHNSPMSSIWLRTHGNLARQKIPSWAYGPSRAVMCAVLWD